ncbi:hypothetical protein ACFQ60_22535 [Streptomyces zhihengii]|uniref:Uncharacterized protein n=2 Tax=Streptomyces zhihengii TaxID=1818004 RepID=A0ABS2UVB6_9ACTN|nr:hypothetical protein [Streptomyces zhihengii]
MSHGPCPSCAAPKSPGKYVCLDCWQALPAVTRRRLSRRDAQAMARLRELHRQLGCAVPLHKITVSP